MQTRCQKCGAKFELPAGPPREVNCPKCGVANTGSSKFCNDCGATLAVATEACVKCNAVLKAGAKFCSECGATQDKPKCTNCQAELAAGAKFCKDCGTKVP